MSLAERMASIPGVVLTPFERKRIIESQRATNGRRRFAKVKILLDETVWKLEFVDDRPVVNCRACEHCLGHSGERQVGTCYQLRQRVSTWHPVLCNGYKAAA